MLQTNLRYFDYVTLKLYKVYLDLDGYHYIRRGNQYEWVDKYDVFDPADGPMLNRTNLARYLRKKIKAYDVCLLITRLPGMTGRNHGLKRIKMS